MWDFSWCGVIKALVHWSHLKEFLPCKKMKMDSPVWWLRKRFGANAAAVRFLSCVRSHVQLQTARVEESFWTKWTTVCFHPCMHFWWALSVAELPYDFVHSEHLKGLSSVLPTCVFICFWRYFLLLKVLKQVKQLKRFLASVKPHVQLQFN
jgi:hypothetical protein